MREPLAEAGEAEVRLSAAFGAQEFVPFVDDDAAEVLEFLPGIVLEFR